MHYLHFILDDASALHFRVEYSRKEHRSRIAAVSCGAAALSVCSLANSFLFIYFVFCIFYTPF